MGPGWTGKDVNEFWKAKYEGVPAMGPTQSVGLLPDPAMQQAEAKPAAPDIDSEIAQWSSMAKPAGGGWEAALAQLAKSAPSAGKEAMSAMADPQQAPPQQQGLLQAQPHRPDPGQQQGLMSLLGQAGPMSGTPMLDFQTLLRRRMAGLLG